jgi:hypothetical protein
MISERIQPGESDTAGAEYVLGFGGKMKIVRPVSLIPLVVGRSPCTGRTSVDRPKPAADPHLANLTQNGRKL